MSKILTFDLGTSYFKVCLFDDSLRLIASIRTAVPTEQPAPGRSELTIPSFERCISSAVADLSRRCGSLGDVTRICFASQANSFTLLDGDGNSLVPFLLWTDQRASVLEPGWYEFSKTKDFCAKTGVAQFDHHFILPKIEWLRRYMPDVMDRVSHVVGMSDYLVRWLTGRHAGEAGISALTGLLDIQKCQYWHEALDHFRIPGSWLPMVLRAGTELGPVHSHFIESWGLSKECRMAMGCLDQYAGAIGAGVTAPGQVCETTGTVLATVTCVRGFSQGAAVGVFQGPAREPEVFYRMMFSRVGAGLLERYRNQQSDRPSFAELDKLAAGVAPNSDGLRLVDGAPDLPVDRMFSGRNDSHHQGHEVRAIMEGVAHELCKQVAAVCGDEWPKSIRSVGGAARSTVWLRIKSEILGCPMEPVDCPEPTSLGAATLAAV